MINKNCCSAGKEWTETFSGKVGEYLRLMLSDDMTYINKKSCQSFYTPIMSLCPMYAAYTLLYRIKGSTCLVHGPIGCSMNRNIVSFLGGEIDYINSGLCNPSEHKTFTTNIKDEDIIFGGEEKLFNAIVDVSNRINPGVIWIFRTCATAITGDDVVAVAARAEKKTGSMVRGINCEGLKDTDWRKGYKLAYSRLIEMVKDVEKDVSRLNVINMGSITRADMDELNRVFLLMNLSARYIPYYSTMDDIGISSDAVLNAVLCGSGGNFFAELMKEKFNMGYVSGLQPIGIRESREWFLSIAEMAKKPESIKTVIYNESVKAENELAEYKSKLKGKKVFICGGAERVISVLQFCLELGMVPAGISLYHCDKKTAQELKEITGSAVNDFYVFTGQNMQGQEAFLNDNPIDLYLGNRMVNNRMLSLNVPVLPLNGYGNLGPHLGFKGAVSFASQIAKALYGPRGTVFDRLSRYLGSR